MFRFIVGTACLLVIWHLLLWPLCAQYQLRRELRRARKYQQQHPYCRDPGGSRDRANAAWFAEQERLDTIDEISASLRTGAPDARRSTRTERREEERRRALGY